MTTTANVKTLFPSKYYSESTTESCTSPCESKMKCARAVLNKYKGKRMLRCLWQNEIGTFRIIYNFAYFSLKFCLDRV